MPDLDYAPLAPEDEPALTATWAASFNHPAARWGDFLDLIGRDEVRVVRRGGRLAGGLGLYRMGQWFGGRAVPMAGVAAVGVGPEHRRTGAARTLMAGALGELRREGVALSALHASTSALYRSVGYERAGLRCQLAQPVRLIGLADRELPVHRLEPGDPGPLRGPYAARARLTAGNLDRAEAIWSRLFRVHQGDVHAYGVGPAPDALEGYAVFTQPQGPHGYALALRDFVATTGRAARRLWTLFADHGSLAHEVTWWGAPVEPLLGHLPEQDHAVREHEAWLLRIVDLPAALTARGYPAGVDAELHLEVTDEVLPENAGRWVLAVGPDGAEVAAGGRGELRADARALAPLYAGYLTPDLLAASGRLEGTPGALAAATRLFAGPPPWMPDMY